MSTKRGSDERESTSTTDVGDEGATDRSEIRALESSPEGLVEAITSTPPPADVSSVQLAAAPPKKKRPRKPSPDGKPRTRKSKSKSSGESLTPPPSAAEAPRGDQLALAAAGVAASTTSTGATHEPVDLDDEEFFRSSSVPPVSAAKPMMEIETRDPRLEQIASAAARARRAHLAKYVKGAIAVSLILCLAAVLRVAIKRNHSEPETIAMAATAPPQVVAAPAAEPKAETIAADPAAVAAPASDPTTEPTPSEPAATTEPAKAEELAAPAPTTTATPVDTAAPAAAATTAAAADPAAAATGAPEMPAEPDPKAAKREKLAAQIALERGKNDVAIEAGERSVKLDPTDGEAWLILGAAYQAKGKAMEARRCFTACLKEGKRGPKGECAAMLR